MRSAINFYVSQFLFNFCRHIPLVGAIAVVVALVFVPDLHKAFGIRYLLWHEDIFKQAGVGFAMGVVVVQVLLAGYLLETLNTPHEERLTFGRLGPALSYAVGLIGAVAFTLFPLSPVLAPYHEGAHHGIWLGLGFLVAVGTYLFGLAILQTSKAADGWIARLGHSLFEGLWSVSLLRVPKAHPLDMAVHGVAVLAQIFAILVYAALGFERLGFYSPLVGVFALLGILVAVYGFLQYFLARVQPALALGLLGFVYLGGISPYQLRYPELDRLYATPVPLKDYDPAVRVPLLPPEAIDFCGETRGRHLAHQKRPLVVVCVSGGGIRAAAWSTAVLHHLEMAFAKEQIDFPCHIRVFTGASGGMVGASYYVANLPNPPLSPLVRSVRQLDEQYAAITTDCLSPIVHAMTYQDVRSTFSPFGRPRDRGQALEATWTANLQGALDQPMNRLAEGEKDGWRPSLIFSPMLVEDGRRLLISNLDLRGVASNDGSILQEKRDEQTDLSLLLQKDLNRFSRESFEFFRLFPQPWIRHSFRLATAARMSASFPYVSPAPTLPTTPRRRVVDAGYYDNDGVSLAASWLFSGSNRDWLRRHVSKIVLIQIRDGDSEGSRKMDETYCDSSNALSRGLEVVSTPAVALATARVSSSTYRNDGLLEILSQQLISELQTRPMRDHLRSAELEILKRAKERQIAALFVAKLCQASDGAAKLQQFRKAIFDRMQTANKGQRDRLFELLNLIDPTNLSDEDRRTAQRDLPGFQLDDRPHQWVDRLLREADLKAASVRITPADEAALLAEFRQRRVVDPQELLRRVKLTYDNRAGTPFFTTVAFEYRGEASLSWYLTDGERADIITQTVRLDSRVALLLDWWKRPSSQDGPTGE
ncbi:MAG: patatin-like phospholipase family protein [Gemmataceae bacterium]